MALKIETTTGEVLSLNGATLGEIVFKRGNVIPLDVSFLENGQPLELPASSNFYARVNPRGVFGGEAIAETTAFEKIGKGELATYRIKLALTDTTGVLLPTVASADASLEIGWSHDGWLFSSDIINVVVKNTLKE